MYAGNSANVNDGPVMMATIMAEGNGVMDEVNGLNCSGLRRK